MHLPLRRSNRRPHPDSPVRVVREGSKARAVPVDRVCLAVSRVRMASRVCPAVRVALAGKMASKAKVAPVDRVCLAVSRVRMASRACPAVRAVPADSRGRTASRACPAVRAVPADSRARVVRALRTDPPRRDPRTQLQRRRRQKTLLKALTPKTLIPRLSNEELPVGVLDATKASGRPYFFS